MVMNVPVYFTLPACRNVSRCSFRAWLQEVAKYVVDFLFSLCLLVGRDKGCSSTAVCGTSVGKIVSVKTAFVEPVVAIDCAEINS